MTSRAELQMLEQFVRFGFISLVLLATGESFTDAQSNSSLCTSLSSPYGYVIAPGIREDAPPGTVLTTLDLVGTPDQISLSVDANDYGVALNQSDRTLRVVNPLKVFNAVGCNQVSFKLLIRCTVLSTGLLVPTTVIGTVFDTNNHRPYFDGTPYTVSVFESTPVGSPIFTGISAQDLDPSDNGYLGFEVVNNGSYSKYFSFRVSTVGTLYLERRLDHSQVKTIQLSIVVKDNIDNHTVFGEVQPQFSTTTVLVINVLEVVDENPMFNQSTYTAVISRSIEPYSAVSLRPALSAFNPDSNSALVYSIVNDTSLPNNYNDGQYFSINRSTGELMIAPSMNFTSNQQLSFLVMVTSTDKLDRFSNALVKVAVSDTTSGASLTSYDDRGSLVAAVAVVAVLAGLLLIALIILVIYIFRRNWSDTGFYWVKIGQQNEKNEKPSIRQPNAMAVHQPAPPIQSSTMAVVSSKVPITSSSLRGGLVPTVDPQNGATSVQDSPFDVDVYMLQESRDQPEGYGTSTFKRPSDAPPPKPARPPKTNYRTSDVGFDGIATTNKNESISNALDEKPAITVYY